MTASAKASTTTTAFDGLLRFAAGAMLGLALVAGTAGPARADVEASAGWPHSWSLISEAI